MSNSNSGSSGGIGVLGLMFIVFLTLKLTDYIDWSWWWVTAPLWGGPALVIVGGGIFLICSLILSAIARK